MSAGPASATPSLTVGICLSQGAAAPAPTAGEQEMTTAESTLPLTFRGPHWRETGNDGPVGFPRAWLGGCGRKSSCMQSGSNCC